MPPKRKARPLPAEEAPPLKRITRSGGVILEAPRETSNPGRVTRSRTTSTEQKAVTKRTSATAKPRVKSVKTQRTKSTRSAAKGPSPSLNSNSTSDREERLEVPIAEASKSGQKGRHIKENLAQKAPTKVAETDRRSYRTRSSGIQTAHIQNTDDEAPQEPPKKGRRPRKIVKAAPAQASPPSVSQPQASTSKVTLEQTEAHKDKEPRDVFTPPLDIRPTTPVRTVGSRAPGTPRYILEVVVNTPSRQLGGTPLLHNVARSARASPIPATKASQLEFTTHPAVSRQDTYGTVESPPPSSSPSADVALAGQDDDTVLPLSPENTPSTSILDDPPSPARSSAASSHGVPVLNNDTISLPDKYLSCLEAQKRAALKQLRLMPVVEDSMTSNGADKCSTNDIAFRQLRELLMGTVERGEGNSCFLTGPRGSGKTQVRCQRPCVFCILTVIVASRTSPQYLGRSADRHTSVWRC